MSSDSHTDDTRRGVLKKGALTASTVAGGLVVGSGSVAAARDTFVRVQGRGEFKIRINTLWDRGDVDITEDGAGGSVEVTPKPLGNYLATGYVDGKLNINDKYAQFKVEEFTGLEKKDLDPGVEVIY